MEKKILELKLNLGIENESTEESARASEISNIILKNGVSVKRPGWRVIGQIRDENGNAKINGIFPFSENGTQELIVHAGTGLYRCSTDFSTVSKINVGGILLPDLRSQGVIIENRLWIFGIGEPLIYDGEILKASALDNIYIPVTRRGITDVYSGDMYTAGESANVLTTKRINTVCGKDTYRTKDKNPVVSLDGDIIWGTEMDVKMKIRVRSYGDGVNETTSIYRGMNVDGNEENMVVTVKFHIDKAWLNSSLAPSAPITDEMGRDVTIVFEDETQYLYHQLPWKIRITGQRQLTFDMDIPSPTEGVDNITITYHSAGESQDLAHARLGATTTTEAGQNVAILVCQENVIRYTDYKRGMVYIPESNRLQIGNTGDYITAIIPISGGYLGAFSENGFYKIKLPSTRDDGPQVYKTVDKVGAYSQWCCGVMGSDTIALTPGGVYGVKPGSLNEQASHLYNRGTRISHILDSFDREQLKNVVTTEHRGKYYIFIDGKVLVADSQKRSTRKSLGASAFEYEWWLWDGCPARCVASSHEALYMGRENGTVAVFDSICFDLHEKRYSINGLSLAFSHDEGDRSVYVASEELSDGLFATVSPHRRRVAGGIKYIESQLYSVPEDQLFDENGEVQIFAKDYYFCKEAGAIIEKIKVLEVNPQACTIRCEANFTGQNGYLYVDADEKTTYKVKKEVGGFSLLLGDRGVVFKGDDLVISVLDKKKIKTKIVSMPISLGDPTLRKSLWGVYVKPTRDTVGEIEIEIETLWGKSKERVRLGSPLDLDKMDFGALAFKGGFDRMVFVPFFERGVNYLTVSISTEGDGPFGIEALYLCYTQGKKYKGEG